ncbi:MAG: hypothetical protein ABGF52_08650 [Candidatus Asgardarchaeum sp.]
MIRVGMMTLALPRERVDLAENFHKRALETLKGKNIDVISPDGLILNERDSLEFAMKVANDIDAMIYLVGTWIFAPMVVTPIQATQIPSVIWAVDDMASASLVGAAVTKGSLEELGIYHLFIYGQPDDESVIQELLPFLRAAHAIRELRFKKFGLIGGRSMGMMTAVSDPNQLKDLFKVDTVHIDQYLIVTYGKQEPRENIEKIISELKERYGEITVPIDVLERAVRVYCGLKRIIDEHNLSFVGVKCQPELIDNYSSACLALNLLSNEGIPSACESDVNAAFTMEILKLISDGEIPVFMDLVYIDRKTKELRLFNCGYAPTKLASDEKKVELAYQYEYMGKMRGVTTKFCLKSGTVTLARLSRIKGKYVMLITKGKAEERPTEIFKESRDIWPHAFIKLEGDINKFIKNIRANHIHLVYGDYVKELVHFCKLLGIEPITI